MVRKRSLYVVIMAAGVVLVVLLNAFVFDGAFQGWVYDHVRNIMPTLPSHEELQAIRNNTAVEALERENAVLRKQLGVEARTSRIVGTAHIFSIQRNTLVSTLLIDRGSKDGIESGMIAVAGGNILIGKVSEVFNHSARIIIADDPRSVVSVRIFNSDLLAESRGTLEGALRINLIAHSETVASASMLVTSGLDGYPPSLAVGEITSIERADQDLFKNVSGKLIFNPIENPLIFILK